MDTYSEYGEVKDVYVPINPETGMPRGFAFVTMSVEDAPKAIEGTDGVNLDGRTLTVSVSLPPGEKKPPRKPFLNSKSKVAFSSDDDGMLYICPFLLLMNVLSNLFELIVI
jgi:RNA recognition motif-containing protein